MDAREDGMVADVKVIVDGRKEGAIPADHQDDLRGLGIEHEIAGDQLLDDDVPYLD